MSLTRGALQSGLWSIALNTAADMVTARQSFGTAGPRRVSPSEPSFWLSGTDASELL